MREREDPVIQTVNVSEARQQFSQLMNRVYRKERRIVVEKSGIAVAAIVSAEDLTLLQRFSYAVAALCGARPHRRSVQGHSCGRARGQGYQGNRCRASRASAARLKAVNCVVLDTNVLASGFVGRYRLESTPGGIIRAWRRGAFKLAVSEVLLVELRRALNQPYFRQRLTDAQIADALAVLHQEATLVSLTISVAGVAAHP